MFTGIITANQPLAAVSEHNGNTLFHIPTPTGWELTIGESININGVCSTVIDTSQNQFVVEYMPETLRLTTVGQQTVGSRLNLERSLTAQSLLSGHFVYGHVDATGTVTSVTAEASGESWIVTIRHDPAMDKYIISKGSISLNGISLTVINPAPGEFSVALIPHTWQHTNVSDWKQGTAVNLEYDVLAKYIEKYAQV